LFKGGSRGHGVASLAHKLDSGFGIEYAADYGCGDLTDRVPGYAGNAKFGYSFASGKRRHCGHTRCNDKWLSNCGVANGVGIALGAVLNQINS
jgi:hypothetical protein